MKKISLPSEVVDAIKNAPRGVVPDVIRTARAVTNSVTGKNTYVSTSPDANRFGNTYRKIGPVSILKSSATPATKQQALAQRRAKK